MTNPHRNIFCYYRGPEQPQQEKYDQQLENNTTKALVNTLEHSGPVVALEFLRHLGIPASAKVKVELQKKDIPEGKISRASHRLLLGLVAKEDKKGNITTVMLQGPVDEDSRDSCPDAWLYGDDFVVLIESKVGDGELRPNQMRWHFRKLLKDTRQPEYQMLTWAKVHQIFVELSSELKDKDKWLVEQFTQYLEGTGMTEFAGFREYMFEFFIHDEKDADTQKLIRATMDHFGYKVLGEPGGLKAFNPFYATHHVGNLGPEGDHFWVAFGPKNFRKFCHQTVSLYDYGLDIFANIELLPVVNKLRRKIRGEKQKFVEIISGLHEPFWIKVAERKYRGRPRAFEYNTIATLEAGTRKAHNPGPYGLKDPRSVGFDYLFENILKKIQYPYLWVGKRIDRKRVLELSTKRNGDDLVEEAARFIKGFHPIVEFINE